MSMKMKNVKSGGYSGTSGRIALRASTIGLKIFFTKNDTIQKKKFFV